MFLHFLYGSLSYSSFQFGCFRGQKQNFVIAVRRTTVLDCTCTEESEPNRSSLPVVSSLLLKLCFSLYSLWSNFDCTTHSSMQPFLLWHCVMLLCLTSLFRPWRFCYSFVLIQLPFCGALCAFCVKVWLFF